MKTSIQVKEKSNELNYIIILIKEKNFIEKKDFQDEDDDEDNSSNADIISIHETLTRGAEVMENNEHFDYQEENDWE